MMTNIVVDTNIVFSALVGKGNTLAEIIIALKTLRFHTSDYMHVELRNHHEKLKKASRLSDEEIDIAKYELFKYIHFVSLVVIPERYWKDAEVLVSGIDMDDIAFVALSLYLDAYLWTGDKVLYNGLKAKGFEKVISTSELKAGIING